jgi:trehalose 6-phosphate synthase
VRRLAALAISVTVAWLAVRPAGGDIGSSTALALGLTLVAASTVGWLVRFLGLPRITGYIVLGLACGPSMANIITQSMARDLRAANGLAVAIIAFIAGLTLDFARLRPHARIVTGVTMTTALMCWAGIGVTVWAFWPWLLPGTPDLTIGERATASAAVAALLTGFSAMVTTAVVTESQARGPLADRALSIAVASEVLALLIFAVCAISARAAFDVPFDLVRVAAITSWQLAGSVAFGAAVGSIFALYVRLVGREVTLVLLALGAVLMGLGAQLQCDPLLAGLAAGVIVRNVLPAAGESLRDGIERGALPILVIFFATVGASMRVEALATAGLVAVGLFALRVALIRAGVQVGATLAGAGAGAESGLLWRTLITTSGATGVWAVILANDFPTWGPGLEAMVMATVALHEIAGPIGARAALAQAGEIGRSAGGLVVVSNREPWMHEYQPDGRIVVRATPGGVSVALDALMRERGGVWIAHGAGSADRAVVDDRQSVDVPPDAPAYRLRRLWLTPREEEGYYAGFANSALWPLCHQAHVRPVFKAEDWETYKSVNWRFAEVVAVEAPPDAAVFLNDYHLALVARALRRRRPQLKTALFWHIPWPDVDRLRICPWRKDIVEGLLNNDLLAFQLPRDQRNFLQAVTDEIGASVSGETVHFGDRAVRVLAIPIGADFDRISTILGSEDLTPRMEELRRELRLEKHIVGVGVDRLDYTKGIPERLAAIERALADWPGLADRLAFVQVGVPSREEVPGYSEIAATIEERVARINTTYGGGPDRGPIRHLKRGFPLSDLVALYRLADFCIVSSLHDGMNLVAKEFVAARDDLDGVLILSELAGASHELAEALIINPYDERGFAQAIRRAIEMPDWERRRRMQAMRRRVAGRDVLAWASDILDRLERRKGLGFLSG